MRLPRRRGAWHPDQWMPGQWLVAGLVILGILGAVIAPHYGEGVDEWHNAFYGWAFVHAYENFNLLTNPGINYYNGPFFMMLWVVISQALQWLVPGWVITDARHFTTFLTFLIGLWLFYRLCLHFMSARTALFTTTLLTLQPVIFGHAFLNQKDTPLMVFFVASIVAGWAAVDRLTDEAAAGPREDGQVEDRLPPSNPRRLVAGAAVVVAAWLLLDLWVFHGLLTLAENVVRGAYEGSLGVIHQLFSRVATDAYKTPLALYIGKVDRAAFWLRLAATAIVAGGVWWGGVKVFPSSIGRRLEASRRRWGRLVLAGLLVGATTSIRLVGPLAGALIGLMLIVRLGRRGIIPTLALGGTAIVTTYLTWPALWGTPVSAFLSHVVETSGFTSFDVLFAGHLYESTNLPWAYLPWLLTIQLTLPAGAAILIGVVAGLRRTLRRTPGGVGLLVIAIWAGIPAAAVIFGWVSVYNNFRHELFLLPPLFVLAGMGVEWISHLSLPRPLMAGLALLALVPGVAGIVRLHPYEYTYYNSLVGGVDGAAGAYELDYWCTSFRAAVDYVDQVAPAGAKVAVAGALTSATPFARHDLDVYLDRAGNSSPELALACNQRRAPDYFPEYSVWSAVEREGAVFAVVKGPGEGAP
jgi:hypothetical protein